MLLTLAAHFACCHHNLLNYSIFQNHEVPTKISSHSYIKNLKNFCNVPFQQERGVSVHFSLQLKLHSIEKSVISMVCFLVYY